MEYLNTIGVILIVNLLGWITPGPNMLAVMSASLSHGRAQGLKLALGLSIGATLWAGLAVAGAATLFGLFPRDEGLDDLFDLLLDHSIQAE